MLPAQYRYRPAGESSTHLRELPRLKTTASITRTRLQKKMNRVPGLPRREVLTAAFS